MGVYGSGTYADPWTYVDLSAYDFYGMVTDGGTYYAKVGTYFDVTDSGDPHDEVDFYVGYVNPNTYGIYISNWNLVGTCSTAGTVTIEIMETWPEYGEEDSKTISLVILPPPSYTVSVYSAGGGTVSGGGTYTQGSTATISATPNTGYHFTNWSDGNTSASRSFTVTGNVSLTAYFAINTYNVSLTAGSGGTVSGGGTYNYGATANISATPSTGYHFVNWSDGSTSASRSFTVTGNVSLTAYFAINTYTVTIATNDSSYGTVSPTSIANVPYGSSISVSSNTVTINGTTVTATKATDTAQYSYAFSSWSNTSGTITSDRTITANFTRSTLYYTATIAVSPSGYGTVSSTSITKVYNSAISSSGNVVTVGDSTSTATPASQTTQYTYAFSSWTNATGNLTANRTITANFTRTLRTYTVSLTAGTGGSVSGGGTYSYGSTVTISATPDSGYAFVQWSDGNTDASRSITVTGNVTLSATFEEVVVGATVSARVNGSWVTGTPHIKVSGVWTPAKAVYVKVNGVWNPTPPPRYGFAAVDITIATSDPSTRCTYPQTITVNGETVNNSCYGFTPMAGSSNGTFTNGSWADHELLKNIIPVVSDKGSTPSFSKASTNASSWTNSSEYFTEFPFNWLSITKDSTKVRIIFSDNDAQPDSTFQCFAHAKGCDSYSNTQIESAMPSLSRETILTSNNNSYFANAFHVGCFLASGSTSAIYSNKNGTPLVSTAYTNYWKAANARGTDYDCFSFQQLTYIQALFVLLFKSTNSQASHSAGYSTGNAVPTTGAGLSTNTFGMAGTIGGGTTRNAFLWIHDIWGSINQYIGGLWLRGDGTRNMYYWLPRQANSRAFNNGWTGATTASTQASLGTSTGTTGSNAWHFIKEVAGSKYAGFYPTVQSGATATTYFSDIGYTESSSSNANFPTIGGFFNSDTYNGIFYVETNRASTFAHASWTARLAYRGGH